MGQMRIGGSYRTAKKSFGLGDGRATSTRTTAAGATETPTARANLLPPGRVDSTRQPPDTVRTSESFISSDFAINQIVREISLCRKSRQPVAASGRRRPRSTREDAGKTAVPPDRAPLRLRGQRFVILIVSPFSRWWRASRLRGAVCAHRPWHGQGPRSQHRRTDSHGAACEPGAAERSRTPLCVSNLGTGRTASAPRLHRPRQLSDSSGHIVDAPHMTRTRGAERPDGTKVPI